MKDLSNWRMRKRQLDLLRAEGDFFKSRELDRNQKVFFFLFATRSPAERGGGGERLKILGLLGWRCSQKVCNCKEYRRVSPSETTKRRTFKDCDYEYGILV